MPSCRARRGAFATSRVTPVSNILITVTSRGCSGSTGTFLPSTICEEHPGFGGGAPPLSPPKGRVAHTEISSEARTAFPGYFPSQPYSGSSKGHSPPIDSACLVFSWIYIANSSYLHSDANMVYPSLAGGSSIQLPLRHHLTPRRGVSQHVVVSASPSPILHRGYISLFSLTIAPAHPTPPHAPCAHEHPPALRIPGPAERSLVKHQFCLRTVRTRRWPSAPPPTGLGSASHGERRPLTSTCKPSRPGTPGRRWAGSCCRRRSL